MTSQRISLFTFLAVVQILIALIVSSAGQIHTVIEAPGALRSTRSFQRVGFEHFNNPHHNYLYNYESNFGLGPFTNISGSYLGLRVKSNDLYGGSGRRMYSIAEFPPMLGGSGRSGMYSVVYKGSEMKLHVRGTGRTGLGFFGLYWASIDESNYLEFFKQGVSIYNYTGADAYKLISLQSNSNAWYGNKYFRHWFYGSHTSQAYGYFGFNFHDPLFDEVRFGDKGGAGFESDDHSIGY